MTERYDFFFNVKFTKMLSFFLVVEAFGLIYSRPSGENSSFVLNYIDPVLSSGVEDSKRSPQHRL